jgi:endoglucanase
VTAVLVRGRRRLRAAVPATLAAGAALLAAACGSTAGHVVAAPSASPVAQLYVDPANPLFAGVRRLQAEHQSAEAAELHAMAETPAAFWAAGQPDEMQRVRQVTQAAAKAGEIPVIVAYDLPHRDACGKFSGFPGTDAAAYTTWINQLAAAIGSGNDIVIVEPDALPDIVNGCLTAAAATERYQLLRYAMNRLGRLPRAQVYLDAGNPGMFSNPAELAAPLQRAGIQYGRGFSADVSNFQWTATVVTWSQQLERAVGGSTRAVIDTSRNGNGPYTGPDSPQWCNPPGRAPGPAPTLNPGRPGISAYLWVKDPGVSDGPCNGGPAAGQFWLTYALELAQAGHFWKRHSDRVRNREAGPAAA